MINLFNTTLNPLDKPTSHVVTEDGIDESIVAAVNEDERRNVLPKELSSNNVMHLSCQSSAKSGFCDVFVIGTFHTSKESCAEVRDVISYLKPEVVFLELCASRPPILESPQSVKELLMILITYALESEFQDVFWVLLMMLNVKEANKLEVISGAEFYIAAEEMNKWGGKVILGDRLAEITVERTWAKLSLWDKLKFTFYLVYRILSVPTAEDLNKDMKRKFRNAYEEHEFEKKFPTFKKTVVDERDQYMSCLLHKAASEHSLVVAVVGKAHLRGIKKYWKQPVEMDQLMQMSPEKEGVSTMEKTIALIGIGVAIALVAIVLGIFLGGLIKALRPFFYVRKP